MFRAFSIFYALPCFCSSALSPRSEVSLRAKRSKKQKFSCLDVLNLFALSSVENFFVAFKIIARYFAFIFGCQILKFTDYLNLLQNTAALSSMVRFFYIFKFALPLWRSKNFLLFDKFCLNFSSYQILPAQQNLKPKK